jgi:hypothetical protein
MSIVDTGRFWEILVIPVLLALIIILIGCNWVNLGV